MCSRRLTTPSMGSLPGSLIQRETRSSCGSRLKANEQARYSRPRTAASPGVAADKPASSDLEIAHASHALLFESPAAWPCFPSRNDRLTVVEPDGRSKGLRVLRARSYLTRPQVDSSVRPLYAFMES